MKILIPRLTTLLALVAFALVVGCGGTGHSSKSNDNSVGDVTLETTSSCGSQQVLMTSDDLEAFGSDSQVFFQSPDGHLYLAASVTSGGTANNKLTIVPNSSMPEGIYSVLLAKNPNVSPEKVDGTFTYNPMCAQP